MSRKMLCSKRLGGPDEQQIEHKQQRALAAKASDCVLGCVSECSQQAQGSDPPPPPHPPSSAVVGLRLGCCVQFGLSRARSALRRSEILEQAQWAPLRCSGDWTAWHVSRV